MERVDPTDLDFSAGRFLGHFPPAGLQLDPNNLPQVVWLRGDESFFSDFCISADEAMDALGIRRSRLTQISGRELRVGRTRVDRYVRPVYRPQDIEAYKTWTRQTASHQKSSDALREAAEILSTKSEQLAEGLLQKANGPDPEIVERIFAMVAALKCQDAAGTSTIQGAIDSAKIETAGLIDQRFRQQAGTLKGLAEINDRLEAMALKVSSLSEGIAFFAGQVQGHQAELKLFQSQHTAALDAMIAQISNLQIQSQELADSLTANAPVLVRKATRSPSAAWQSLKKGCERQSRETNAGQGNFRKPARKTRRPLRRFC